PQKRVVCLLLLNNKFSTFNKITEIILYFNTFLGDEKIYLIVILVSVVLSFKAFTALYPSYPLACLNSLYMLFSSALPGTIFLKFLYACSNDSLLALDS